MNRLKEKIWYELLPKGLSKKKKKKIEHINLFKKHINTRIYLKENKPTNIENETYICQYQN